MHYDNELMSYLRLDENDRIITIDEISDGLIKIKPKTPGRIVHLQNQVSADVWFSQVGCYGNDPIRDALQLRGTYNEKMHGVVMSIPKAKFAVHFDWRRHQNIRVRESKALSIPYFLPDDESKKLPSRWYEGDKQGVEYQVGYIHDVCEDAFSEFVLNKLKFRKIRKSEREDRGFPESSDRCLTDESETIYDVERSKLELLFAQITGLHSDFLGGLIYD